MDSDTLKNPSKNCKDLFLYRSMNDDVSDLPLLDEVYAI
jgi:hypothetical protein